MRTKRARHRLDIHRRKRAPGEGGSMRTIGYLCSEYPAISHTFISREISILEKDGFDIRTASINPTKNPEALSEDDLARMSRTYCIKGTPWLRMLMTAAGYSLRLPRFLSVLAFSLRLCWANG